MGVVQFGNARNDRQAKPGALAIAQAYEALEQLATQLAGDAWAAVGNFQGQVVRCGMQLVYCNALLTRFCSRVARLAASPTRLKSA